jgi:peptidoglycan hydrolase CwlO-like protein
MRALETAIAKLNIVLGNRVVLEPRKLWRRSIRRVQTTRAMGVDSDAGSPVPEPPSSVAAMRARLENMTVELENTEYQVNSRVVILRRIKAEWREVGLPLDEPLIGDETALGWKKIYELEARITYRRDNAARETDRTMREVEELWKLKHHMEAGMAKRTGGTAQDGASGLRAEEERRKMVRRQAIEGTIEALCVVGAEESAVRASMTPLVHHLNERSQLIWDALSVPAVERTPLGHDQWDALQLGAAMRNCKLLEAAAAAAGTAGDQVNETRRALLAAQDTMSELRVDVRRRQMSELRSEVGRRKDQQEASGELSTVREEADRLRQDVERMSETEKEFLEEIFAAKQTTSGLRAEVEMLNERLEATSGLRAEVNMLNERLEATSGLRAEVNMLNERLEATSGLRAEVDMLNERLEATSGLRAEVDMLNERLEATREDQEEMNEMRQEIEEMKGNEQELFTAEQKTSALRAEVDMLNEQLEAAREQKEEEVDEMRQEIEEMKGNEQELFVAEQTISELRAQVEQSQLNKARQVVKRWGG